MKRLVLLALLLPVAAGCPPPAPVGANTNPVPRDSASTCAGYCQAIGLALDSVVIMANNVGCVCSAQPPAPAAPAAPAPGASSSRGAAGAGGIAALMQQWAAARAAAQQRQQQQR